MDGSEDNSSTKNILNDSERPSSFELFSIDAENARINDTNARPSTLDGKIIDFVLVYKTSSDTDEDDITRQVFEENLCDYGIDITKKKSENLTFVLLHCPWDTLCRGAQLMKLKKALKTQNESSVSHKSFLSKLQKSTEKLQVHMPFSIKDINNFAINDKEDFFSNAERHYICYSIMERTIYIKDDVVQNGLENLLEEKVYTAAYPLHNTLSSPPEPQNKKNLREYLLREWASVKSIHKQQPLPEIRSYFGEQVSFYFAWLGIYTWFLAGAALVGILITLYGIISLALEPKIIKDICDSTKEPGNYTLCPKCLKQCNYYQLVDVCDIARFSHVFDNASTVYFGAFIGLWAIFFCEMWKRRQNYLKYLWSVNDFESHEVVRTQYKKIATKKITNPITKNEEFIVPSISLFMRRLVSNSMIFFILVLVLAVIIAILMYRLSIAYALYQSDILQIKKYASIITALTAAILNLIFIMILSKIYIKVVKILTDIEAHKTKSSYEDSFIFKLVIFQFINNYGSIIYIAFFKGSFVDRPGKSDLLIFGNVKQDECGVIGCMWELTLQLLIIMVGKQVLNEVLEIFKPQVTRFFKAKMYKVKKHDEAWELDFTLSNGETVPLYSEYLEMVIQYGFVVLFAAAFPLAPVFALINNLLEIRFDAYKLLRLFKMPPGFKSQDIGAWEYIIETFSHLAVISNAFILAWTSDFIPKTVYMYLNNNNIEGYVDFNLASFNTSNFPADHLPDTQLFPQSSSVSQCRYRAVSVTASQVDEKYESFYWQLLGARWAFVIVFEHCCFLVISLCKAIPDKNEDIKVLEKNEKEVLEQVNANKLFSKVKQKMSSNYVAARTIGNLKMANLAFNFNDSDSN